MAIDPQLEPPWRAGASLSRRGSRPPGTRMQPPGGTWGPPGHCSFSRLEGSAALEEMDARGEEEGGPCGTPSRTLSSPPDLLATHRGSFSGSGRGQRQGLAFPACSLVPGALCPRGGAPGTGGRGGLRGGGLLGKGAAAPCWPGSAPASSTGRRRPPGVAPQSSFLISSARVQPTNEPAPALHPSWAGSSAGASRGN